MRKITGWTLVLGCALALLSVNGTEAQRTINDGGGGGGSNVVPVAVSNFPSTQAVTGTVAVGNFPLTVNVRGTVDVGNLPIDDQGNVRVAGELTPAQPPASHFVGITHATVEPVPDQFGNIYHRMLPMNRACQAEFPRTTVCRGKDLATSVPAPPEFSGLVLFVFEDLNIGIAGICLDSSGLTLFGCSGPQPVGCCGT